MLVILAQCRPMQQPGGGAEGRPGHDLRPRITGLAQLDAWLEDALPPIEEVRPGLWSLPLPTPESPLRYLLVYALELEHGLALVDAGAPGEECWVALTRGLISIGAGVGAVQAVLLTGPAADGVGLAPRIREASGAWVTPLDRPLLERERLPFDGWQLRRLPGPDQGFLHEERHRLLFSGRHLRPALVPGVEGRPPTGPAELEDLLGDPAVGDIEEVLPAQLFRFAPAASSPP
jgi:hypothetical protein